MSTYTPLPLDPGREVDRPDEVRFEGEVIVLDTADWRYSTRLKVQILAAWSVYVLFGLGEQAVGTLIPKLQEYYQIGDTETSFVFLATVVGYFVMAIVNDQTHRALGYRGVVVLGCALMTFCFGLCYFKPPFWLLVVGYHFNGFGLGALDASLNSWMGNLDDSNQLLGILHGCYGIGCMISPPLVSNLLEKTNPWAWNEYYLVLVSVGLICLVLFSITFPHETAAKYRYVCAVKHQRQEKVAAGIDSVEHSFDTSAEDIDESFELESMSSITPSSSATDSVSLLTVLKLKMVWTCSIMLFIYVGGEVSFGAWLVSFLMRVKDMSYTHSSYMATAFWIGLTLGRICLGFVTVHYFRNELTANFAYISISAAGFLVFWLLAMLPLDWVLFVVVLVTGLSVGPIFPTTIVTSIHILPPKYHGTGIGFICAFGGAGSGALSFIIGSVADGSSLGLKLFPFIVFVLYLILMVMWGTVTKLYGPTYN